MTIEPGQERIQRTAPGWFVRWLKGHCRDLRIVWNAERENWEVWRLVDRRAAGLTPDDVPGHVWHLREGDKWPQFECTCLREPCTRLCDELQQGASWLYGGRRRDFVRERVSDPAQRVRESKRRAYVSAHREMYRELARAARRDLGMSVTIGGVRNERMSNTIRQQAN